MKITYIGHSGFLAETEHVLLLFDYYQGEIPALPGDKTLYVFASHRHRDHFNPEVFGLTQKHPGCMSFPVISGEAVCRRRKKEIWCL